MRGNVNPLLERISIDPRICGGKPCIKGTRIWVSLILDFLADDMTEAELLDQYPGLTHEDVLAAIAYGAEAARERVIRPRRKFKRRGSQPARPSHSRRRYDTVTVVGCGRGGETLFEVCGRKPSAGHGPDFGRASISARRRHAMVSRSGLAHTCRSRSRTRAHRARTRSPRCGSSQPCEFTSASGQWAGAAVRWIDGGRAQRHLGLLGGDELGHGGRLQRRARISSHWDLTGHLPHLDRGPHPSLTRSGGWKATWRRMRKGAQGSRSRRASSSGLRCATCRS